MRWRFADPLLLHERPPRERTIANIDAWWRAFAMTSGTIDRHIRGRAKLDIAGWMNEHLGAVHPEIMWEFGPGLRGGHRLVMTPERQRHLRPLVAVILDRAPALPGWEFYPYRLPETLPEACITVKARCGEPLEGFRACATPNDGGVNVTLWSSRIDQMSEDAANSVAFVAVESLLGEECLDKFVDAIEVADRPSGSDVALTDLRRCVDTVIASERETLAAGGFIDSVATADWLLLKLKPRQDDDYTGQTDLMVAKTAHLPLWQRSHSNLTFSSDRYSRCGETFAYVKLDGSQGLDPRGFADKSEIEDALEAALGRERLGVQIGGGTGLRYSYVDLALTDVDRASRVIQDVLREGRVPKRSWLQFFDDDLSDEWIGIWNDSPAPPMDPR